MEQRVTFEPFTEHNLDNYLAFARAHFGTRAYQASPRYVDWLYRRHPHRPGYEHFLVVRTAAGKVVGCIHKLVLPWRIDGATVAVPTLHNLMIHEPYRRGTGFFLFTASVKGDRYAIIPGVTGALSEAYQRLKYQKVPSYWYRRIVAPLRLGVDLARARLPGGGPAPRYVPAGIDERSGSHRLRSSPDAKGLERLAAFLTGAGEAGTRPGVVWTPELVAWRFFAPTGPRHLLVESGSDPEAFAVLSLGPRHGLNVARLVVLSAGRDPAGFVRSLSPIAHRLGADVMLAFSARRRFHDDLLAASWRPMRKAPDTYLYKRGAPLDLEFDAAATDLGFEAIEA